MVEIANQTGGKTIGGFHNLESRFGMIQTVTDFIPIVSGDAGAPVCVVEDTVTNELMVVHLDHLGFFIPKNGPRSAEIVWQELNQWLNNGKMILSALEEGEAMPLNHPIEEYQLEPVPEETTVRATLVTAKEILTKVALNFKNASIKFSKDIDMVGHVAAIRSNSVLMPSNIFLNLAEAYTQMYIHVYPFWKETLLIVAAVVCEDLCPLDVTKKIFTPLFVEKITQITSVRTIDGEQINVVENRLALIPFKGYHIIVTPSGSVKVITSDTEVAEVSLVLNDESIIRALKLEEAIRTVAKANAGRDFRWKLLDKTLTSIQNFYNSGDRFAQQAQEKYMKLAFQLPQIVALIQSQMRLNMAHWNIDNAMRKIGSSIDDPATYLALLQASFTKTNIFLAQIERASAGGVQMGAFNITDVRLSFDDGVYGSVSSTPVDGPNATRLFFHRGPTKVVELLNDYAGRKLDNTSGNRKIQIKTLPMMGLWSPYNNCEFTELGNMGVGDQKSGAKRYLTELNAQKLGDFSYELKYNHGAPPNSLVGVMYNLRHTMLTTAGAIVSIGVTSHVETTNITLSMKNTHLVTSIKCLTEHGPRGFFGRVRCRQDEVVNTFDVTANVSNIKGRAFFNNKSKKPIRNTPGFNKLEWITNPITATKSHSKMSKKVGTLMQSYDMKKMIQDLESVTQHGALYYLRPHFVSPMGMNIQTLSLMENKNGYVNAPFLMNVYYNVTTINGVNWCTTGMEGADWNSHKTYKIVIDKNRLHYNPETIVGWTQSNTRGGDSCENPEDIVNALLNEVCDDEPVCASVINDYMLQQDIYNTVVKKLTALSRFYKDVEFVYAEPALNDDIPEEETDGPSFETTLKRKHSEVPVTGLLQKKVFKQFNVENN